MTPAEIQVGDQFEYRLQVAGIVVEVMEVRGDRVLCRPTKFKCPPEWLEIRDLGRKVKK